MNYSGKSMIDSESEPLVRPFLALVCRADALHESANRISYDLQSLDHPWRSATRSNDYAIEAVSAATSFLGAATNSFLSLRLLTIDTDAMASGKTQMNTNTTLNGTAGLLRQSLECAARAHWITSATSLDELVIRGFAATWANAEEAVNYANAIGSPEAAQKKGHLATLREEGLGLGKDLMVGDPGKEKPRYCLLGGTDSLQKISFPPEMVCGLEAAFGRKVANGEWVYRWLSGMAHGHGWVHTHKAIPAPEEAMQLVVLKADWNRLTLSIMLTEHLIRAVVAVLDLGPAFKATTGESGANE
jgi:hypothetical protein